jgi:hypothetical protein
MWRWKTAFALLLSFGIAGVLAPACGGNGDTSGPGGSGGAGGSSAQGGNPSSTGGAGGSTPSTGGSNSTGGAGGAGGMPAFGPCHEYTDDFEQFNPASNTDYWEIDQTVTRQGAAGMRSVLATPDADNFAGLFTSVPEVATNCFTSIEALGTQGDGFYVLQVLEGNDSGRMLIIQVTPGMYEVDDITSPTGDGTMLGTGTLDGDLRGMRIQLLPGMALFDIEDASGWKNVVMTQSLPAWITHPVRFSFGYRGIAGGVPAVGFDSFNLDAP